MVFLSVTATRGEQIVGGLEAPDFAVFEDGRPQRIEVFSRDPQPIALSLLIDASMSMESKLGLAADAAVGFVERLGDQDKRSEERRVGQERSRPVAPDGAGGER